MSVITKYVLKWQCFLCTITYCLLQLVFYNGTVSLTEWLPVFKQIAF